MGSLGIYEWVVALLGLGLVIFLIFATLSPRRIRRFLSRLSERGTYGDHSRYSAEENEAALTAILPFLLALWSCTVVGGFSGPSSAGKLVVGTLMSLGILSGILLHLRPNHSRRLKYAVVIAAITLPNLYLGPGDLLERIRLAKLAEQSISNQDVMIWWYFVFSGVAAAAIIALVGAIWIRRTSVGQHSAARWEHFLFDFIRMRCAGPIILATLFVDNNIAMVLLMTRYVAIERFRKQPMIYLRSFHYDGAADTFGHAIAPGLSRYGVTRALVHSEQKGSLLTARTSIWQFGLLTIVPDEFWQTWVADALRSASAVVIDCSVVTRSVIWEISQALSIAGSERVLIITSDASQPNVPADARVLLYSGGGEPMDRLRAQISDWARSAFSTAPKGVRLQILTWVAVAAVAFAGIVLRVEFFAAKPRPTMHRLQHHAAISVVPRKEEIVTTINLSGAPLIYALG